MNDFNRSRNFLLPFLVIVMLTMLKVNAAVPLKGLSIKPDFKIHETLPCPVDGDDIPTCVRNRIKYPEKAVAQNIEGEVIIEFTVDENGNVIQIKIIKDIGGCCGMAASCAIKRMKFRPAIQNGFPVACTMRISVRFELT
jgi:protein TonB